MSVIGLSEKIDYYFNQVPPPQRQLLYQYVTEENNAFCVFMQSQTL